MSISYEPRISNKKNRKINKRVINSEGIKTKK